MSQPLEGQSALVSASAFHAVIAAPPGWSRRPKGIDRGAAARLLAEGRSIAEVAGMVGCSRQNLWRQVQRSKRLARLIRSAETEANTDAYGKLAGLAGPAVDTLRRAVVEEDDTNVALRLVHGLNLFERPAMADPLRGEMSPGWDEFAAVLAAVTQRAMAAARRRNIRFSPHDYRIAWEDAVKERKALREAGAARAASRD